MIAVFSILALVSNPQLGKLLVDRKELSKNNITRLSLDDQDKLLKIPSNIDGIAQADYADEYGYKIHIDDSNKTLWVDNIDKFYICGDGEYYTLVDQPNYQMESADDPVGWIIVIAIGILLLAIGTGTWPLLISIQNQIKNVEKKQDIIIDDVKQIKEDVKAVINFFTFKWLFRRKNDPNLNESERKSIKDMFTFMDFIKYAWMLVAVICMLFVSILASQVLCVQLGWRNMVRMQKSNKCYFINTTGLIIEVTNKQVRGNKTNSHISKGRHTLESSNGLVNLQNITSKATMKVGSEIITFASKCEGAIFKSQTGEKWKLYPSNAYKCESVQAVYVKKLYAFSQARCTLGKWSNDPWDPPSHTEDEEIIKYYDSADDTPKSGIDLSLVGPGNPVQAAINVIDSLGIQDGEWKVCTGCCGLFSWGNKWRRARAYALIGRETWEKCYPYQHPAMLSRINKTGYTENIPVKTLSYSDPRASRAYGWFQKGNDEIVSYATFNKGFGTSIIFDELTKEENIKLSCLAMTDFNKNGPDPRNIMNVSVKTSAPECIVQFNVERKYEWTEFYESCREVSIDSDKDLLRITTKSDEYCTVPIKYSSGMEHTVTIRYGRPASLMGVIAWKCSTFNNSIGYNCSQSHEYETFQAVEDDGVIRTIPNVSIGNTSPSIDISILNGHPSLDIQLPRVLGQGSVKYLGLYICAGVIGGGILLLLIVFLVSRFGCCNCSANGANSTSTTIVIPESKNNPIQP